MPIIPALREINHEFEVILSHTVSEKPNWETGDLVSGNKNKTKKVTSEGDNPSLRQSTPA